MRQLISKMGFGGLGMRLQPQLQGQPGAVRRLDAVAGADPAQRVVAGLARGADAGPSQARGAGARHRSDAAGLRRAGAAGRGPPGALPSGRPVPGHVAIQRPHHGRRRADGRAAGGDVPGGGLPGARGGQPAARHRAARADHALAGRLRGAGAATHHRPAAAAGDQGASAGQQADAPAVRQRPLLPQP